MPTGFAICLLGAFYGLFNKIALLSVKVDESKCVHCNACLRTCKMDIKKWEITSAFPAASARKRVSLVRSVSVGKRTIIKRIMAECLHMGHIVMI